MPWVPYDEHLRSQASDVPLTPSTNAPDTQNSAQDTQDESWTQLIGRTLKESALPIAGGLLGAGVGSLFGGAGAIPGEMIGSAGGEWLSQKLGLTPKTTGLTGMLDPGVEQILMAGALPGIGRGIGAGSRAIVKSTMGGKVLAREVAQKAIGDLETPIVDQIQHYFQTAGTSGNMVDLPIAANMGNRRISTMLPHTFQDAADAINNLKNTINGMASRGEVTTTAERHLGQLESRMEKEFPGWMRANRQIESIPTIKATQGFVNSTGPLADFEQALAEGRVMGTNPIPGGGRLAQLPLETQNEIRSILADLGPQPGANAVRTLIEGRALGHVAGSLLGGAAGFHEGGMIGGATGMLAGMFLPTAMDTMIAKSMSVPVLRAFIKGAIDTHSLGKPQFWAALGQLGTRLVGNTFIPQPPPPTPPTPPMAPQPPPDEGSK